MSFFEKYLSIWVTACIFFGIALGNRFSASFELIASWEVAHVNIPVAILIWLMIIPMLLKIDFGNLNELTGKWKPVGITVIVNWLFKPAFMAFLAWLFISNIFDSLIPESVQQEYIAGLIILAAAPCTAMVFVWCNLCQGDSQYTFLQVAINDLIMIFAFAPIVGLLLGLSNINIPWNTLFLSLILYLVVPTVIAHILRKQCLKKEGITGLEHLAGFLQPISTTSLLLTIILLFAFQGEAIQTKPLLIILISIPILVQVVVTAATAYWLNWSFKVPHNIAGPSSLIAASNFFELAVATAISLFGIKSGAALATVVGVLVEVPIMLLMVKFVNITKPNYLQSIAK